MGSTSDIDTGVIVTLADDDQNSVADFNTNFTEIVTKFNTGYDTSTGHDHDGSNSKSVSAGIGALTSLELVVGQILGGFE